MTDTYVDELSIRKIACSIFSYVLKAVRGAHWLLYLVHVLCVPLSAGLFESDKLLFSFAMTTKIQEVESQLNHEELDFFIKVQTLNKAFYVIVQTGCRD